MQLNHFCKGFKKVVHYINELNAFKCRNKRSFTMKTRSKLSSLVMILCVVCLAGVVQAKTLKISHVRPQDTAIDKDLRWFSETLKTTSGGKIKTKIYPASALGDYTVVQERV